LPDQIRRHHSGNACFRPFPDICLDPQRAESAPLRKPDRKYSRTRGGRFHWLAFFALFVSHRHTSVPPRQASASQGGTGLSGCLILSYPFSIKERKGGVRLPLGISRHGIYCCANGPTATITLASAGNLDIRLKQALFRGCKGEAGRCLIIITFKPLVKLRGCIPSCLPLL
jgi:hypothetical protein